MTNTADILKIAKLAAVTAGKKALEVKNSSEFKVESKSDNSQVSAGDYASEAIVKKIIQDNFPDHLILSEESASGWKDSDYTADHLWIVDPIDGTTNYVYGIPHSAVSIAYAQKGLVQCAAVYNLFIDELFYAERGRGAFVNDKQIWANKTETLQNALVATGLPYLRPIPKQLEKRIISVSNNCRDLRRLAAASLDLCYVACGRLDAYFETVQSWDMAAGTLIAREAGCLVTNLSKISDNIPDELDGNDLLASCPEIFNQLSDLLK